MGSAVCGGWAHVKQSKQFRVSTFYKSEIILHSKAKRYFCTAVPFYKRELILYTFQSKLS